MLALAGAALGLTLTGSAVAGGHVAVPAPPASPTSASQIQNIDQVKTAIKGYYGDTTTAQVDPVDNSIDGGDKALHTFSSTSAYVKEMAGIEAHAQAYLEDPYRGHHHHHHAHGQKAVLFDVDDTTLNTYSYEIYSNFVYNPTTNAAFVNAGVFPAVPGMPALVSWAQDHGYTVFFLTGRPESQRAGTQANLQSVGYPAVPNAQLYLKDLSAPWLSSCATSTPVCTTVQYKSLTRQHIESMGYDIVANFGDQYSDLTGGFADKTFKVPNPMYFLP
ncbi:acid phosphatase [Nocardioides marmorisolisilvae]|uniref:Acid phosphatase n=1 Tax=Nocardioides marmorisolisilvae TaxID=1542737 RepID=A0A3N0DSZ3_9ACTN|nr:acid phosphatase [Nocardioides marmorisolisilvae]